jgi:RNA polymerase sigma factor (sigma-70 family)
MVMGPQHRKETPPANKSTQNREALENVRELTEISRALFEKIPSLVELVVTTGREAWESSRQRLSKCEKALEDEGAALQASRGAIGKDDYRALAHEQEWRRDHVRDLRVRADALFAHGQKFPPHIPITTKAQVSELLGGLHHYREIFWRALYEVPSVQRFALEQLRKVTKEGLQPSTIIHHGSVEKPDEEALLRNATKVVQKVERLLAKQPTGRAKLPHRAAIASVLVGAPLDPAVLSEQLVTLKDTANKLADLEIGLKCDHGSIRGRGAHRDPRFAEWRELSEGFGGGALVARETVANLVKAEAPYARIKQYLTTANLPFIQKIVGRGQRYRSLTGDMIQEGALGFMRALDKFDPNGGFALLTYAGYWIHQRASRGYERQVGIIYVPNRMRAPLARLSEEPSRSLGQDAPAVAKRFGVQRDDVEALIPLARGMGSLDATIQGTELSLGANLPDHRTEEPEVEVRNLDKGVFRERLLAALQSLTEREREILTLRFGLDGNGERTLSQVAEVIGVSRERIRQVQDRAIDFLKNGPTREQLERLSDDIRD